MGQAWSRNIRAPSCRGIVPESLIAVTHNYARTVPTGAIDDKGLTPADHSRSKPKSSRLALGATAHPWVESRQEQRRKPARNSQHQPPSACARDAGWVG